MKTRRLPAIFLALLLAVQLALPAFAAGGEADLWEQVKQGAAVYYAFEGNERTFDGTRTLDATADLDKVKDLDAGTIIVRARYTGSASSTAFSALLGLGNPQDDSTRQIVLGANGSPFSSRYEFGGGLYSTAMRNTPWSDGKWHTLAFTAGADYVSVSVDGASGSTGADGYYGAERWAGFFTRCAGLDSFTIGGFSSPNYRLNPYANWVGEIDFVAVTPQVLAPAEADRLTASFRIPVEVTLEGGVVETPAIPGSPAGTLVFSGEGSEACVPTLSAGLADNDKFVLAGNTLKTAVALAPYSSYTVVVSAGLAGMEDARFTVTTLGEQSGPLLVIDGRTEVTAPVRYPALVPVASTLSDMTLKVQFVQKSSGIGSLFSLSNSTAQASHWHLYANGSTIGYELRGAEGSNWHHSASALRSGGLNTVAFKADSATHTFKIFANGRLVDTRQMDADTYLMVKDIIGLDAVTIGETPRNGNGYPFTGTLLGLEFSATAESDEDLLAYTAATKTDNADEESPHIFEGTGSQFFRIPALYTLNDGSVLAALDARFGGAADSPNNLDTAVALLPAGSSAWGAATLPLHFIDYTDEPGYVGASASYIDPVVGQGADGTVYMAVDAFPSGYGYPNAATGTGMKTVDGEKVLALTQRGKSVTDFASFDHYVKDGVVYKDGGQATAYTMDENFCLYKDGEPLYVAQKRPNGSLSGQQVPMSVFYADSDLKVYGTSYLFLVESHDGGQTWGAPQNLNYLKRDADRFWGTGPGRGHTVQTGAYAGRVLLPTYDSQDGERSSMIYTDDGGQTWQRGARVTMASSNSPGKASESQLAELPDGTLRLFARGNTGYIGYADSHDGGASFEPMKQDTGLAYCGNVMISVINYSGTIDGKPALVLSCPEGGGRNNGIIRIGLIEENPAGAGEKYSIDWRYKYAVNQGGFVYSCLTELPNGDIALLWENNPNNTPCLYSVYTVAQLMQGAKSGVAAFAVENAEDLLPGGTMTATLTLKSRVVEALSDLENTALTLSCDGLGEVPLAFAGLSGDGLTLTFTGALPASDAGYAYTVAIPDSGTIFTLNGWFGPIAGDVLSGAVNHPVDTGILAALVDSLEGRAEDAYTPATWTTFAEAIAAAKALLAGGTASQNQLDAACEALAAAAGALEARADKAALAATVAAFESLNASRYTPDSWDVFFAALADARAALADENSTQARVNEAESTLFAARFALVPGVDKTLLEKAVALAKATDTEGCTEGTITALAQAIQGAEAVLADPAATTNTVTGALNTLLDALEALKDAGDKRALLELYQLALLLDGQVYTPAGWAPFEAALWQAYECLENLEAGQAEVDAAYTALRGTMMNLLERADKASLAELITRAQAVLADPALYAPATLEGLQAALDAALPVLADENATQSQVNGVGEALLKVLSGLRLKANKTGLSRALTTAQSLDLSLYTAASATPLRAIMRTGETMMGDENALQDKVDETESELIRLMGRLVKRSVAPPPAQPEAPTATPSPATPFAPGLTAPAVTAPAAGQAPLAEARTATPAAAQETAPPAPETMDEAPVPAAGAAPTADGSADTPAASNAQQPALNIWLLVAAIALLLSLCVNVLLLRRRRRRDTSNK